MRNTFIVSDLHLCEAETPPAKRPLWKKFKSAEFFIDGQFQLFLQDIELKAPGPKELILNGDIFDFDSVMAHPKNPADQARKISWLEKKRGLFAQEAKSLFKFQVILNDHKLFVEALREFILKENDVIFIIGNHDLELHWPDVQRELRKRLDLPSHLQSRLRFCEWYYISEQDTLIEHGNQYDDYCLCSNPIHPFIEKGGESFVRLPFGNLAGRFMLNGMGLMNPHVDSSFIKPSIKEYLIFFYRYVFKVQPFLVWDWMWGATVTFLYAFKEALLPAKKNPLNLAHRQQEIAQKAQSDLSVLYGLKALHVHPAIFKPWKVLKELWLDRLLLIFIILFIGYEFFSFVHLFGEFSIWWFVVPVALLVPAFIFYARSVESEVKKVEKKTLRRVNHMAQLANVERVVLGHTHREFHRWYRGVEVLNTGTWSPAFYDVECEKPYGRKCFVWIRPQGEGREAELYEWRGNTAFGPLSIHKGRRHRFASLKKRYSSSPQKKDKAT